VLRSRPAAHEIHWRKFVAGSGIDRGNIKVFSINNDMTTRALPCLIAALILACAATAPQAANAKSSKAAQKDKSSGHSVKIIKNPYQETPSERERRLKRECKGMPNAGACLGYGI
jgi:hypothetical protein